MLDPHQKFRLDHMRRQWERADRRYDPTKRFVSGYYRRKPRQKSPVIDLAVTAAALLLGLISQVIMII